MLDSIVPQLTAYKRPERSLTCWLLPAAGLAPVSGAGGLRGQQRRHAVLWAQAQLAAADAPGDARQAAAGGPHRPSDRAAAAHADGLRVSLPATTCCVWVGSSATSRAGSGYLATWPRIYSATRPCTTQASTPEAGPPLHRSRRRGDRPSSWRSASPARLRYRDSPGRSPGRLYKRAWVSAVAGTLRRVARGGFLLRAHGRAAFDDQRRRPCPSLPVHPRAIPARQAGPSPNGLRPGTASSPNRLRRRAAPPGPWGCDGGLRCGSRPIPKSGCDGGLRHRESRRLRHPVAGAGSPPPGSATAATRQGPGTCEGRFSGEKHQGKSFLVGSGSKSIRKSFFAVGGRVQSIKERAFAVGSGQKASRKKLLRWGSSQSIKTFWVRKLGQKHLKKNGAVKTRQESIKGTNRRGPTGDVFFRTKSEKGITEGDRRSSAVAFR